MRTRWPSRSRKEAGSAVEAEQIACNWAQAAGVYAGCPPILGSLRSRIA